MKKIIEFFDGFVALFVFVFIATFSIILPVMFAWRLAEWILR